MTAAKLGEAAHKTLHGCHPDGPTQAQKVPEPLAWLGA